MKIFSAAQTRAWDAYTIAHEPVASIDLMERAARACTEWLLRRFGPERPMTLFCGPGNNGGDGLAIARLLHGAGRTVTVFIPAEGEGSADFGQNRERLLATNLPLQPWSASDLPGPENSIIIDALFGTGLGRPLAGAAADLVERINNSGRTIVSIDLPSGLQADARSEGTVVHATHTLTFGAPKLGQLLQENGAFIGELHLLDIGLPNAYASDTETAFEYVDRAFAQSLYRPRSRFAHKGSFGHALLAAGAYGKMGAAVMAAMACLRGGSGLLSCHCPRAGAAILQSTVPEAMLIPDNHETELATLPEKLRRFAAIGIGPGIGSGDGTVELLAAYLRNAACPLVLDADALNILARNKALLSTLPAGSILTPHPKEFDRLFGEHASDFDRISTALAQATRLNSVVLLKGHHTFVATPAGRGFFNSTGNAGMAKGGSGDVLTGLLTALRAQGYSAEDAAVLGVWLHGKAADIAVETQSYESLLPTDLVAHFGAAFRGLYGERCGNVV
ncbi:NAD(P)H-hydrate epimerase [Flaviaesturariibacter terrae]